MTMIQPGSPPRRRNRILVVGLVLLALGFLGGVVVAVSAGRAVAGALNVDERTVPADIRLQLTPGDYAVYERVGTAPSSGVPAPVQAAGLTADRVAVTGPDAAALAVRGPGSFTQNLTINGKVYAAFAFFTAPSDGTYDVKVSGGDGADGALVTVKPTLGSTFSGVLPWIGGGIAAGVVLVVGLVLTIVGAVRRRRSGPVGQVAGAGQVGQAGQVMWPGGAPSGAATTAPVGVAQGAAGTPAGWYPDPQHPGVSRWWDGTRWTDHTR